MLQEPSINMPQLTFGMQNVSVSDFGFGERNTFIASPFLGHTRVDRAFPKFKLADLQVANQRTQNFMPALLEEKKALDREVDNYVKTSTLPELDVQVCALDPVRWLKYYANLAILASTKPVWIQTLRLKAVQRWWSVANVCQLASLSFADLFGLIEHILGHTEQTDNGIRIAVIMFAASMREKFHTLRYATFEFGNIPTLDDYLRCPASYTLNELAIRCFIEEEQQLYNIEQLLQREEPVAWLVAKSHASTPLWMAWPRSLVKLHDHQK